MRRTLLLAAALALIGCADDGAAPDPTAAPAGDAVAAVADAAGPQTAEPAAPAAPDPRDRLRGTRDDRRTFDGAPPVIPHPLDEYKEDCLYCHTKGLSVGGVWSPETTHPELKQCQQCHVHVVDDSLGQVEGGPPDAGSLFEPLRYGPGTRSFEGAPPTIPHPIGFMRQSCASCHGQTDDETVRPEHYKRTQCLQCHVPDAEVDVF